MDDTTPSPSSTTRPWWRPQVPRWLHVVLVICAVLLLAAAGIEGYRRMERYAKGVVKQEVQQLPVGIVLKNTPPWLHKDLLALIRKEAEDLARRDLATFRRFQNPLDQEILREIAAHYVGTDKDGVERQTVRHNAWIKRISEVRRVIQKDKSAQWIEIVADYRRPAACVAVPYVREDKEPVDYAESGRRVSDLEQLARPHSPSSVLRYYLLDEELARLPGEYATNPVAGSGLLTLYGLDQDVPLPGHTWSCPEAAAGLKVASLLARQPYATQIALVNLANYNARVPSRKLEPQILLETVFPSSTGDAPSVVDWGRPLGEERFWEVHAPAKLKALAQVFTRYNRIDAGRDYVDIRFEQVKVPIVATKPAEGENAAPAHPAPPRPRRRS